MEGIEMMTRWCCDRLVNAINNGIYKVRDNNLWDEYERMDFCPFCGCSTEELFEDISDGDMIEILCNRLDDAEMEIRRLTKWCEVLQERIGQLESKDTIVIKEWKEQYPWEDRYKIYCETTSDGTVSYTWHGGYTD
jgi:hypothetical protein